MLLSIVVAPPVNWGAERNVLRGLDRLRVTPGDRRGLDVGAAHAFSQWQACLWSALCLNQLLQLPLREPRLSGQVIGISQRRINARFVVGCWMKSENGSQHTLKAHFETHSLCPRLFSGTLVHGLFRYLKAGQAAESLLPGGTQAAQLYCPLLAAARTCSSQIQQHSSAGARSNRGGQRRGRQGRGRCQRGGRGACRGGGDSRELSNMFAALMNDDEFDEVNDW